MRPAFAFTPPRFQTFLFSTNLDGSLQSPRETSLPTAQKVIRPEQPASCPTPSPCTGALPAPCPLSGTAEVISDFSQTSELVKACAGPPASESLPWTPGAGLAFRQARLLCRYPPPPASPTPKHSVLSVFQAEEAPGVPGLPEPEKLHSFHPQAAVARATRDFARATGRAGLPLTCPRCSTPQS